MGSLPINISASRGAAILGYSQWSSPLDIWLQIMEARKPGFCKANGYTKPEFEESAALKWGLLFEDTIILLAQKKQKSGIYLREHSYVSPNLQYVTCHIDGLYKKDILHEGKTTNAFTYRDKWGEPGTDRIPVEIQIQVQHQMICTGVNKCIVSVLVFPKRQDELEILHPNPTESLALRWGSILDEMGYFHQYEIEENLELQKLMIESYMDFWQENVSRETPPDPMNYSDIRKLVKEPKGTIIADEQIERWSKEYKDLNSEFSSMNKRKDELKTLMLDYMRNNAEHHIDDDSVEKWILRDMSGRKLHHFDGKRFR